MTRTNDFSRALKITLQFEGGNVDRTDDPGGRTSRGITQRVYDAYCAAHHLPAGDVYKMSEQDLEAIYYAQYWVPVTQGRTWPLNAVLFDSAVHSGVGQAIRWIEAAKTRVAADDPKRMLHLAADVMKQRETLFRWLAANRGMNWALKGWLNRLGSLRKQTDL
ncbi:glycosyl hydrolase 108 family protein [Deinococcus sp. UYEF24]